MRFLFLNTKYRSKNFKFLSKEKLILISLTHVAILVFLSIRLANKKDYVDTLVNSFFFLIYIFFLFICLLDNLKHSLSAKALSNSKKKAYLISRSSVLLLHFSTLIILIGMLISQLFFFQGGVILTEGEKYQKGQSVSFILDKGLATTEKSFHSMLDDYEFRLIDINRDQEGFVYSCILSLKKKNTLKHPKIVEIMANNPLKLSSGDLVLTSMNGFSPFLSISDNSGNLIFQGSISLSPNKIGEGHYRDKVKLNNNLLIELKLDTKQQILDLSIKSKKGDISSAIFYLGDSKSVGEYVVSFQDIKSWVRLDFVYDGGYRVSLVGCLLFVVSLLLNMLNRLPKSVFLSKKVGEI